MTTWTISPEELGAWARDVLAQYTPREMDYFVFELLRICGRTQEFKVTL